VAAGEEESSLFSRNRFHRLSLMQE